MFFTDRAEDWEGFLGSIFTGVRCMYVSYFLDAIS